MQQADGKGRRKHPLRKWALPLLVVLLLVGGALAVLHYGIEGGRTSEGKRRSIDDLPQPFRWFAQRRQGALLKEIETLQKAQDERSFQRLLVLLVDRDETVRRHAFDYFKRSYSPPPWKADERAMKRVASALKDRDPDVRMSAVRVLIRLGDKRAVEPLIAALKDADFNIPRAVADSLGKLEDPRAVEPLIAALKDTSGLMRVTTPEALKMITGQDFGTDAEKWRAWWQQNKARPKGGNDE